MKAKLNISFNARATAQVIALALYLLGCMCSALGYLRGILYRALVRMDSFALVLYRVLISLFRKRLQVTERRVPGMGKVLSHAPLPAGAPGFTKLAEKEPIRSPRNLSIMEKTIIKRPIFQLTDKAKEWMVFGICIICMALFASAAYGKVAEHQTFVKGLSRVSFIGEAAIYLAWLVPVTEIMVSILLIIPATHRRGLYGFTGLMTVFTLYILSMIFWAEKLPCHCNLIIEKLSWGEHVWFNLGFIALAVYALWLTKNKN